MGVQLQLSLEDPLSSLMYSPLSKQKDVPSPAPMRKKQLPWNLHCLRHSPMLTIIQSPYSFAQTVSPCVKPSYHIAKRSPSAIPSVPFHLQSLSSGSLALLLLQATISRTKQPKKLPSSPQTQLFSSLYLALFKSSTKRFVTLHQHKNRLPLSTNIEGFLKT